MCRCQDIPALALVGQVRETEENNEDNRYHPDEEQVALQDLIDFDLNETPKMLAPKAVMDLLAHLNLDVIKLGLKRALADRGGFPVLGQEGLLHHTRQILSRLRWIVRAKRRVGSDQAKSPSNDNNAKMPSRVAGSVSII